MTFDSPSNTPSTKPTSGHTKTQPSREAILDFIRKNPGQAGKRAIAKAFNLKGENRIWLKELLRSMTEEGAITSASKRLTPRNDLPPVAVLEIFQRDSEGGFIARPSGEFFDKDRAPPLIAIRPHHHNKGSTLGVGSRVLAKIFRNKKEDKSSIPYTGRVIRTLPSNGLSQLGLLHRLEDNSWRLIPIDRKMDEMIILDALEKGAREGDLISARLASSHQHGLKRGKICDILGHIENEKSLSMIAIISKEIPYIFPDAVLKEAQNARPASLEGREDWRTLPFITIDPSDAKDHDDAVYATQDKANDNHGGAIVYVAIADVAHYIKTETEIDKEARKRGNSVYFPDRVVPMLPERISNDLCSLREGEDRPALAVRMVFNQLGEKIHHSFHRVMVRSAAKLSYEDAQKALNGQPSERATPFLETSLKPLWAAYALLQAARQRRQPLDLDLPERKILLDESGRVQDVVIPPRLDAHKLIEEFMIQANVCAAQSLRETKQALIYRCHDEPSLAKQESLLEFLHSLNLPSPKGQKLTAQHFNSILTKVTGTPHQNLVNQVVLRTQSQADYSPDNIGHFGLNLAHYAHFTSPIRRYADLIIHRALIKALALGEGGLTCEQEANLTEIARDISQSERRAMVAERETIDRLVAHYLASHIGARFAGRIAGVTKAGLFIAVDPMGADGFIPISSLGDEYYHFDEARHTLIGERTRKGFQLGDSVEVQIENVQPLAGALRLSMISQPRALNIASRSYHKIKKLHSTRKKRR
ncbi:ribonuclease R [Bartonella sp. DGB2]|uniref:ribonuclease R n=1 Tax=Bartonella sp. DGB2 TaxID=3388426 RepID=UPI00398FF4B9